MYETAVYPRRQRPSDNYIGNDESYGIWYTYDELNQLKYRNYSYWRGAVFQNPTSVQRFRYNLAGLAEQIENFTPGSTNETYEYDTGTVSTYVHGLFTEGSISGSQTSGTTLYLNNMNARGDVISMCAISTAGTKADYGKKRYDANGNVKNDSSIHSTPYGYSG